MRQRRNQLQGNLSVCGLHPIQETRRYVSIADRGLIGSRAADMFPLCGTLLRGVSRRLRFAGFRRSRSILPPIPPTLHLGLMFEKYTCDLNGLILPARSFILALTGRRILDVLMKILKLVKKRVSHWSILEPMQYSLPPTLLSSSQTIFMEEVKLFRSHSQKKI